MAQRVANIMKPFATGLVVGKFAPLHCGHERLIITPLAQCEELFIISYSVPEMPDCEPEKRLDVAASALPASDVFGTDARACCAL